MGGSRSVVVLEASTAVYLFDFDATESVDVEDLLKRVIFLELLLIAVDVAVAGDDDKRQLK